MSDGFYSGYYDARVQSTEWVTSSKKGTVGLRVDIDVHNAQGQTRAMSGYIWFSAKTMAPSKRKDGTLGRSMAERQLNGIGYTGAFANANQIGRTVSLRGNKARVKLVLEEYDGEERLKVNFFCDPDERPPGPPPATTDAVDALFDGIASAPTDEHDDEVPF